jgi:hypothetical protein
MYNFPITDSVTVYAAFIKSTYAIFEVCTLALLKKIYIGPPPKKL